MHSTNIENMSKELTMGILHHSISSFFFLGVLFASPSFLLAEEWAGTGKLQHRGDELENRIIKWCKKDSLEQRYASANVELKGYVPCGKLLSTMYCDATGKKYISKNGEIPYGYLDCARGTRLIVERHEPLPAEETELFSSEDFLLEETAPLSTSTQNQQTPPLSEGAASALSQYFDALDGLLNPESKNKISSEAIGEDTIEDAVQHLPPSLQQLIRSQIGMKNLKKQVETIVDGKQ